MAVTRLLHIRNEKGLHARASAKFVETVEKHEATARVSRDGATVAGNSIMGLMMLGAAKGSSIEVECSGLEEAALADALQALVDDLFGEGA
jgi:phosphocarrier protein